MYLIYFSRHAIHSDAASEDTSFAEIPGPEQPQSSPSSSRRTPAEPAANEMATIMDSHSYERPPKRPRLNVSSTASSNGRTIDSGLIQNGDSSFESLSNQQRVECPVSSTTPGHGAAKSGQSSSCAYVQLSTQPAASSTSPTSWRNCSGEYQATVSEPSRQPSEAAPETNNANVQQETAPDDILSHRAVELDPISIAQPIFNENGYSVQSLQGSKPNMPSCNTGPLLLGASYSEEFVSDPMIEESRQISVPSDVNRGRLLAREDQSSRPWESNSCKGQIRDSLDWNGDDTNHLREGTSENMDLPTLNPTYFTDFLPNAPFQSLRPRAFIDFMSTVSTPTAQSLHPTEFVDFIPRPTQSLQPASFIEFLHQSTTPSAYWPGTTTNFSANTSAEPEDHLENLSMAQSVNQFIAPMLQTMPANADPTP